MIKCVVCNRELSREDLEKTVPMVLELNGECFDCVSCRDCVELFSTDHPIKDSERRSVSFCLEILAKKRARDRARQEPKPEV